MLIEAVIEMFGVPDIDSVIGIGKYVHVVHKKRFGSRDRIRTCSLAVNPSAEGPPYSWAVFVHRLPEALVQSASLQCLFTAHRLSSRLESLTKD